MDPKLQEIIISRNEDALEDYFEEGDCKHFFNVDWREDDEAIVEYCANRLNLESLHAEWRDDKLVITYNQKETVAPLIQDAADRHITACTLNDILSPKYQIRFIVCSHGDDTVAFAALSSEDWESLERASPILMAENFIDPRKLPNIMTELTQNTLPKGAKERFERLLERRRL